MILFETNWKDYAIWNEEDNTVTLREDAPPECVEEFKEYIESIKQGIRP